MNTQTIQNNLLLSHLCLFFSYTGYHDLTCLPLMFSPSITFMMEGRASPSFLIELQDFKRLMAEKYQLLSGRTLTFTCITPQHKHATTWNPFLYYYQQKYKTTQTAWIISPCEKQRNWEMHDGLQALRFIFRAKRNFHLGRRMGLWRIRSKNSMCRLSLPNLWDSAKSLLWLQAKKPTKWKYCVHIPNLAWARPTKPCQCCISKS